ncbi:MAG: response regulator [Acidobacteria bacterium]|nr:response regulator [Acidobacteriota bacterium]MBI3280493.1 response regulator [Acidobacteriota bacterium]
MRHRVLVAQEDAASRRGVHRLLTAAGYKVSSAANGIDALDIASGLTEEEIALLVTDVDLPLMSGLELAERLREDRPHLKILFLCNCQEEEEPELLRKPFTSAELLVSVARVLNGHAELALTS